MILREYTHFGDTKLSKETYPVLGQQQWDRVSWLKCEGCIGLGRYWKKIMQRQTQKAQIQDRTKGTTRN